LANEEWKNWGGGWGETKYYEEAGEEDAKMGHVKRKVGKDIARGVERREGGVETIGRYKTGRNGDGW